MILLVLIIIQIEMKDIIQKKYGKLVRKRDHKTEIAKNFTLDGHIGSVSFITSMTNRPMITIGG